MPILKNQNLSHLNTFQLQSHCEFFFEIHHSHDLDFLLPSEATPENASPVKPPSKVPSPAVPEIDWTKIPKRILGGGSNLILSEKIPGLVLKNSLKGHQVVDRFVHVASGEIWHDFVLWCLKNKFYGLENLSLIPGTVGAAPIQNIGAYGVEVKKYIHSIKGIHLNSGLKKELFNSDCQFEYRHSIFKTPSYSDFFITEVVFHFPENSELEYSYGELKEFFQSTPATPEKIAEKVIEIRTRKLPDLMKFPNAGSYFKNPLVSLTDWASLRKQFPDLISYPYNTANVKLSAGQLIEKCGFKGKVQGTCAMYEKQALIMVNLGKSFYQDVLKLEQNIIQEVQKKFHIRLEAEPIKW